ncbi:MAG: DUF1571 domain-containing protein [Bacteroidales bacterium]|nr:MAG: DUF1571 domain-containing protein [Bacteroidales bacterium]
MKRSLFSRWCIILVLLVSASGFSRYGPGNPVPGNQEYPAAGLLRQMISNIRSINSLEFSMKVIYRIEGEQIEKRGRFKLVNEPFRIYYKQEYPRRDLEILYVDGKHNNRILVNPNSFPWINFTLDPYGRLMSENRHQTIFEAGFRLIADILESFLVDYSEDLDKIVRYSGKKVANEIPCHHIIIEIPDFRYINYTTREGETVASIAQQKGINSYMIMENNPGIGSSRKSLGAKDILIPNCYAKRIEFCVDREKLILTSLEVYDDKGLFESFDFGDIKLNVSFHPEEFNRDFPEYGFK